MCLSATKYNWAVLVLEADICSRLTVCEYTTNREHYDRVLRGNLGLIETEQWCVESLK